MYVQVLFDEPVDFQLFVSEQLEHKPVGAVLYVEHGRHPFELDQELLKVRLYLLETTFINQNRRDASKHLQNAHYVLLQLVASELVVF